MDYKKTTLYFIVTVTLFSFSHKVFSKINNHNDVSLSSGSFETYISLDSLSPPNFITKKIIYNAPESGTVNFVWFTDSFSSSELLSFNPNTTLIKHMACTPMVGKNGVFKVLIVAPKDIQFYYGFHITKDKFGAYTNLWDWKNEEVLPFANESPIIVEANYSLIQKTAKSLIIPNGWLIFMCLLLVLFLAFTVVNKWCKWDKPISIFIKTLILGWSMYLLHVMARAEILRIRPKSLFVDSEVFFQLFRASLNDLLYITILVAFILGLLILSKRKKAIYIIFVGFAFVSTIIAFTNITTVLYLGQPFNYEWLYYSDFLGSDDAKNAFQENLSVFIIFNLITLGLSLFVLSKIFQYVFAIAAKYKYIKYSMALAGAILVGLLLKTSAKSVHGFSNKGKTDNAILAMVSSLGSGVQKGSFFSMPLSEDDKNFIPNNSEKTEPILNKSEGHKIRNVVLIVLESSGARYFDDYGGAYKLTPNLSKYASEALIFNNVYAHAPSTAKSMVSILGSIYPYVSYLNLTKEHSDFKHPTLSSVLKNKGYNTSFFTSSNLNFQNSDKFLNDRGFDVIEDFSTISCEEQFKQKSYKEGDAIDDACLSERFKVWIDKNKSENIFSMLWTVQGHYPYFFSQKEDDFEVNNIEFNRYLNTIKHNDQVISDIIQTLKDNQLYESTLIVVTGDHGEAFGQHGQYGHGSSINEENIRIPLYFINPILFHGERKDDIVSMKDLASTTLSLLEIEVPEAWQGRDIINTDYNEAFFFEPWSDYLFGYRKDDMKYIFNETTGKVEVYDLSLDPEEKTNLYEKTNALEIDYARKRIASWVQYQDNFVKRKLLGFN